MNAVKALTGYALSRGLIEECECIWAMNTIIDVLGADDVPEIEVPDDAELSVILDALTDFAYENGTLKENSVVYRDLFDTEIMGRLTPRPAQVISEFGAKYAESPETATEWYYEFSQDTNYI